MAQVVPEIGPGSLFVPEVVSAPALPEDFDLERPASFSHLIKVIGDAVNLPSDYSTPIDLDLVVPTNVEAGLHFTPREAYKRRLKHVYQGVALSPKQFRTIARSPSDLAGHMYTRNQEINDDRPPEKRLDRDTAHQTASRAAGHVLVEHVLGLDVAGGVLSAQLLDLQRLMRAVRAPGRAYWLGSNLDALRRTASDIIHGHIEIAGGTLGWTDQTADDLQRALHYNLYGHNGHNNRRLRFWAQYVFMSGTHTRRQLNVTHFARANTSRELVRYQPYLDAKRADEQQL